MKMLFQTDPCWQIPALEEWGLQALLLTRAACTRDNLRWGLWGVEEMAKTSTTQFVRVRREALVSCMTCPLCNKLLEEATTISECLHSCEFSAILMMAWILSSNVMIWFCCVVWYYGLGLSYYSELMLFVIKKSIYWSFVAFLWSGSISYGWLEA